MKNIGLISDTHIPSRGNDIPKKVFDVFKNVDLIIHAGDFEEIRVFETLEKIAPTVAVHGNMCNNDVKKKLPESRTLQVEDLHIGLYHGSGGPNEGYFSRVASKFDKEDKVPDIIVCGHTHQPVAREINKTLFINPGSPTDKLFSPYNSVAILNIDGSDYSYKIIKL
ncbi:MAG: metallophosphoesterase family protein [Candidatus Hodarchaeales archaeon]